MTTTLRHIVTLLPVHAGRALFTEAEVNVATPARHIIPRKRGNLRNTIHVTPPERESNGDIVVRVVAGGPSDPHAIALHEHPDNRQYSPPTWHGPLNYTTPGTGSKYIERPMLEAVVGMADRIAADIMLTAMV